VAYLEGLKNPPSIECIEEGVWLVPSFTFPPSKVPKQQLKKHKKKRRRKIEI